MNELAKLLLFRDVVDAGGFSHAAARRGLSHSTVSKHIKSLEESVGLLLLNRTSRTMSLTEAGLIALRYSRRLSDSLEELHDRLDEVRGSVAGELRVSSVVHVGRHLVQPAVARFVEEFPSAVVHLTLSDGPLEFNRDGLDLAVRVGLHAEGSLTASKLLDNEVCVVAAPSLLTRVNAPVHPSELSALPTLGYASPQFDIRSWAYRDGDAIRTVEVDPICRVNEGNALLDLALAGVGFAYVSTFAAHQDIQRGMLVRVLEDYTFPSFDSVYAIAASTPQPPLKLRAFKRHLRDVANELAG